MAEFKINTSEFRHPIKFQRFEEINNFGIIQENWIDLYSTRAKINNTTGKEFIANNGITSSVTTRFTIRYNHIHKLTTKDRLIYKDKVYNITYINNILEKNNYLEIVGELVE